MNERPIDIWRRKLDYLQRAEALASDPAQQFTIREQIKEAQQRIAELESGATTHGNAVPKTSERQPAVPD